MFVAYLHAGTGIRDFFSHTAFEIVLEFFQKTFTPPEKRRVNAST